MKVSKKGVITKKQHYIPQVYLRGFSPEYEKDNKSVSHSRYTIYCHDLNSEKQNYKAVPIKSICYRDNLYEVTGSSGEIVLLNHLEDFFSGIEKMFGEFRSRLERKAFIEDNYRIKCFLTNDEKIFWVTYIIIQILRIPQILEIAEKLSREILGEKINIKQAKNIARQFCLPFFKEIDEDSDDAFIINALFEPMKNMSFGIGVDRHKGIITSDKTVYISAKSFPCDEYDEIVFPISSELCLFLFGNENKRNCRKNFLFPISDEIKEEIIKSMAVSSFGKIYSNHILDKNEKKYINEVISNMERKKVNDIWQN